MNEPQPQGRVIHTEIELDASAEDVWRALTDAEWLTNWFPPKAKVKPGVGGSIWVSWGEGMEWETPISHWEPNRRLRLVYMPATPPDQVEQAKAQGMFIPYEVAVDYHIESRGGKTVLRLVHSGFAEGDMWDNQYDGTVRGWAFELRGLKHFLERHHGEKRVIVHAKAPLPDDNLDRAWTAIMGPEGLNAAEALNGASADDSYSITTSDGDALSGVIHIVAPPKDLCATVEEWNDALLRLRIDVACMTVGQSEVNVWLSTFGVPKERTDGLQQRWDAMVQRLFAPAKAAS